MEKKTPLYEVHVSEGGKIVPFADYLLPVQYPTGILAEHEAVRTQAGLFDVSHMLTNPNTLGLFDPNIIELCRIVHEAGGLCYYDGANLNAIMGRQVRCASDEGAPAADHRL